METLTDDELERQALAADPDPRIDGDAVPLGDLVAPVTDPSLLPEWYMPAPAGGVPARRGWRRRTAITIIASFVLIDAAGLCSTYGHIVIA